MQAHLQRLEVERRAHGNGELAVEHEIVVPHLERGELFDHLREVARERLAAFRRHLDPAPIA